MSQLRVELSVFEFYRNYVDQLIRKVQFFRKLQLKEIRFPTIKHLYVDLEELKGEVHRLENELIILKRNKELKRKITFDQSVKGVQVSKEEVFKVGKQNSVTVMDQPSGCSALAVDSVNQKLPITSVTAFLKDHQQHYVQDTNESETPNSGKHQGTDKIYDRIPTSSTHIMDSQIPGTSKRFKILQHQEQNYEKGLDQEDEYDSTSEGTANQYGHDEQPDQGDADPIDNEENCSEGTPSMTSITEAESTISENIVDEEVGDKMIVENNPDNAVIAIPNPDEFIKREWKSRFCNLCPTSNVYYTDKERYQAHLAELHLDDCDICEKCDFELFTNILQHHSLFHCVRFLNCSFCPIKVGISDGMWHHITRYHKHLLGLMEPDEEISTRDNNDITTEKILQTMMENFTEPLVENERFCIVPFKEYALYYDKELKAPLVCAEILPHSKSCIKRQPVPFYRHDSIGYRQVTAKGIRHLRYACGHVAMPVHHSSDEEAYKETFALCNIIPVFRSFNHRMFKVFGDHLHNLTTLWDRVVVITELVYDPTQSQETVGCYMLNVPTKICKTIYMTRPDCVPQKQAFVLENFDQKLTDNISIFNPPYRSTIQEIARLTGRQRSENEDIIYSWEFTNYVFYCNIKLCRKCFISMASLTNHRIVVHKQKIKRAKEN